MMLRLLVGLLIVIGVAPGAWGRQRPDTAAAAPTRIAVLHIGSDDTEHGRAQRGLLGVAVLPDSLVQAAVELAAEKPDIVVLRFDSGGGPVWPEQIVSLIERGFRSRFRTVAWIKRAESEAGLIALSIPEIVVTPTAVIGAAPARWWPSVLMANINLERFLELGRSVATIGGRSPELIRSMQIMEPLSVDRAAGSWVFRQDVEGARVLNSRDKVLVLEGAMAAELGIARGTASNRSELTALLGLKDVEWVGVGVDLRLQKKMERNTNLAQRAGVAVAETQETRYAMKGSQHDVRDPSPSHTVARLRRAVSLFSEVDAAAPSMMQRVGMMAGVFNVRELRGWAARRVAEADRVERPTRVAVLNVGSEDSGPERRRATAANLPVSAYVKAAEELKAAGVDVAVLKINSGDACGAEAFVDAVEHAFRPRFRAVGWVAEAFNESAVAMMALPEVCMTPEGRWGAATCHVWNPKMCDALLARAAALGGRSSALVQSIAYEGPLSVSVVDGKRVFSRDESGVIVVPNHRLLALNAASAEECGVSIGTAATREDLANLLGLKNVEWVGADIDARVQARCEHAAAAFDRVRDELVPQALLANLALLEPLPAPRLSEERAKRDAAWGEVLKLRGEWPELAVRWPVYLVRTDGWGANRDATWADVAREVGMEKDAGVVK